MIKEKDDYKTFLKWYYPIALLFFGIVVMLLTGKLNFINKALPYVDWFLGIVCLINLGIIYFKKWKPNKNFNLITTIISNLVVSYTFILLINWVKHNLGYTTDNITVVVITVPMMYLLYTLVKVNIFNKKKEAIPNSSQD